MPTAKHNLKVQGADRTQPDPEISPYYMQNAQGLWLHWRVFRPFDPSSVKAIVVLCHGLAEHHGRYEGFADYLNQQGYLVYMMEHQGHGSSEGDRKHVERFEHFVNDQVQFIKEKILADQHVKGMYAGKPFVLLGHSLGGLIASNVALEMPDTFKCMVLSSPALGIDEKVATPFKKMFAGKLSDLTPKAPLARLYVQNLCTNQIVVDHYAQDPVVPSTALTMRLGKETMDTIEATLARASNITLPVSVHHGGQDAICLPEGSQAFVDAIGSEDKGLTLYPDAKHEILNEVKPIRDEVKQDMLRFMDRIVSGGTH